MPLPVPPGTLLRAVYTMQEPGAASLLWVVFYEHLSSRKVTAGYKSGGPQLKNLELETLN